jgi:hypothetical protein
MNIFKARHINRKISFEQLWNIFFFSFHIYIANNVFKGVKISISENYFSKQNSVCL